MYVSSYLQYLHTYGGLLHTRLSLPACLRTDRVPDGCWVLPQIGDQDIFYYTFPLSRTHARTSDLCRFPPSTLEDWNRDSPNPTLCALPALLACLPACLPGILHCIGIDIDIDDIDIISKPLRAPPPLSPSLYICDVCSRCSTRLGSLAWLPYRNYVRTPPRPPPPPPPLPSRGGVSRYNVCTHENFVAQSGAGEPGERARRAADDDDRHQTSLISHLLGKQVSKPRIYRRRPRAHTRRPSVPTHGC